MRSRLATARPPDVVPRGVYACQPVRGRRLYAAVTSWGERIATQAVEEGWTAGDVIAFLFALLDDCDPLPARAVTPPDHAASSAVSSPPPPPSPSPARRLARGGRGDRPPRVLPFPQTPTTRFPA